MIEPDKLSLFKRLHAVSAPRWLPGAIFVLVLLVQSIGVQVAERTSYHQETRCLDGKNYFFPMARSLWAEGVPRDIRGNFCTHQPPFFPLMLAPSLALVDGLGIGEKRVAQVFNITFASLATVGVFLILRGLLAWSIALAVALAFGSYPPFIWLCRDAYNEPLFTALFVWGLVLMFRGLKQTRKVHLAVGASLLALATLTRAIGLPVPFLIAAVAWLSWTKSRRQFAALWVPALSVYLAVVACWSVVVSVKAGHVSPVVSSLNWSHMGGMIRVPGESWTSLQAEQFVQEHPAMAWPDIARFHWSAMESHPGDYFRTLLFKTILPWYGTDSRQGLKAMLAMNLPLVLLAMAGLVALRRNPRSIAVEAKCLLVLLLYFWGMTTFMAFSVLRYMVPVMWITMFLAGVFAESLLYRPGWAVRSKDDHPDA